MGIKNLRFKLIKIDWDNVTGYNGHQSLMDCEVHSGLHSDRLLGSAFMNYFGQLKGAPKERLCP